ncbi:hypothetical protein ACLOJK_012392 [Asimina triloba]
MEITLWDGVEEGRKFSNEEKDTTTSKELNEEPIYSGVGAGRTISKRTPHSLDREDRQDFVIRRRTYSNSNSLDSDRGDHRNTSYQQIPVISFSDTS